MKLTKNIDQYRPAVYTKNNSSVLLFLFIHMDTTLMIHVLFIDVSDVMVGAFRIMSLFVCSPTNCTVITERYIPHSSLPNIAAQKAALLFYLFVL